MTNKAESGLDRDLVLLVAKECGFAGSGTNVFGITDKLERFAAAMYAAGAEAMRERAKAICSQLEDDYLEHRIFPAECDMTQAAAACGSCANLIAALPISDSPNTFTPTNKGDSSPNLEGEQG